MLNESYWYERYVTIIYDIMINIFFFLVVTRKYIIRLHLYYYIIIL